MHLLKILKLFLIILASAISLEATCFFHPHVYENAFSNSTFELSPYQSFFEKHKLKKRLITLSKNPIFSSQECYLSDEVTNYIEEILAVLQENSINREKIDWKEFRYKFYTMMNGCAYTWQTYSKMNAIIILLGDNHSQFYTSEQITELHSEKNYFLNEIKGKIHPKNIAYLKVPETSCVSGEYAQQLRSVIRELDQTKPNKWIIDLRGNFGGNMWEILAGLSPLLDKGVIGYFGENLDDLCAWIHEPGVLKLQKWDEYVVENFKDFFSVRKKNPYIAVLIDSHTASSAEATTIAFKGNRNTKLFGSKTYGLSTGNRELFLSDGSFIALTRNYFFDRNRQKYTDGIEPDVHISSENLEHCLEEAVRWLNNQRSFFLF